ncbi:hypothetical protein [Oceanicella sp. SM1341]|uniref:hypothetical protein n=1 Tax=Oceanicella sp. SM1341 TaxID=1548889 RepID=UPI000E54994E|nr:hypothetical protein [Oceanicella sp. SM1341]
MGRQTPNSYTDQQILRMLDLQAKGWTGKAIAEEMTRCGLPMSRAGALGLLQRVKRETDASEGGPVLASVAP